MLRHVGFARFPGNPAICGTCIKGLNKLGVFGAEIAVSLLFADIRGSTGIGERLSPTEFRAFLDRFYRLASSAILENDGIVDKFVGDEAIGLFFTGVSGTEHAARPSVPLARCSSGQGREADEAGSIPVGAAVHTGEAFVGSTGAGGAVSDFTALGDAAEHDGPARERGGADELLVSVDAARAAAWTRPRCSTGR